uniref:Cilia and flagella associated protein 77 n=1 Tax=Oncorhynchus mykiss TaxID=8022 RepID=A0A8C7VQ74_ONCMY
YLIIYRKKNRSHSRRPGKDFVALNREGVKSGLVTAKEHYQYRATHDRRQASLDSQVNVNPVFCRLRPSTPICELLEHKYAQRWLEEQQAKERPKLGRIQETRTTLLRKSRPMPESTPLWKLPRFQQVGPALDTFRDPYARKKAFNAHFSDSVARTGQLGQGTYTVG